MRSTPRIRKNLKADATVVEKTIIDEEGRNIIVDVPRDREGEIEPLLIPKGARQFKGFDEKVISLYARV